MIFLQLPGQHKLRGFLATSLHLELFSLRAYFKVLRQKVPYFNVSRQKIPYFNVSRQNVPYFNICDVFNWYGTLTDIRGCLHSGFLSSGFGVRGFGCSGFRTLGVQFFFQTFGVFGVFDFRMFGVEPRT